MIIRKILDTIKNLNISEDDIAKAVKYLQYYKYLKKEGFDIVEFLEAVVKFQKIFGLDTDSFSLQTLTAMEWKRCGCPDNLTSEEAALDNQKWAFSHIKYYIEDVVPGLTKDEQRAITRVCADDASRVCGLTFEEVFNSNQANVVLRTGRSNGLGTSGNVLAYAYIPSGTQHRSQLEAVFDLADIWVKDSTKRGILYRNVCNHEVFCGHSMGLMHSQSSSALMAPFYSPAVAGPQPNDDIPRLQARYGKPKVATNPTPTPTPVPGNNLVIEIAGNVQSINIPGYRIQKLT